MSSVESRSLEGPLSIPKTRLLLHNRITLAVANAVSEASKRTLASVQGTPQEIEASEAASIYRSIVAPPRPELGDMAIPCFFLAKALKRSPAEISALLAKNLKEQSIGEFTSAGPYLNVRISDKAYHQLTLQDVLSGEMFVRRFLLAPPVTMFEFSQPNTHKELHVGHMRNLCLGDALARCAKYVGIPITTATFPGDVGTHVAKCLWYLKIRNTEPVPESGKGAWLGSMYSKATAQLEAEEATAQAAGNREEISLILKQLEEKQGEYYELWKTTRQWSIDLLEEAYRWARVSFDRWYWESEVDTPSVEFVRQLHAAGKVIESEGALGVDLSAKGLGFCMLLKSDGNGLYATKDLLLAQRKFEQFKLDKSIYLVDERQSRHFKQVFAVLETIGFAHWSDCFHLAYNFVELPDGAMSSRRGNIVPLQSLILRMEGTVRERYLNRYRDNWSEAEISRAATLIAQAAIKFGMNQVEPNTKIVFDMDKWLRLEGDSGPYVQYACARIRSLVRKAGEAIEDGSFDATLLRSPYERALMVTLNQFNDVVVRVIETLKTNLLSDYLMTLAREFNSFYAQEPIVSEENKELSRARVALSRATELVLTKGLELLGIEVPDRM